MAYARELAAAAVSNLDPDTERCILLGLQAIAVSRSSGSPALREAEEALHRAVQASRVELTLRGHPAGVFSAAFSLDGSRLASIDQDGTARVWDAVSGTTLLTLDSRTTFVNGVAFSPDRRLLATAGNDGHIHLWDVLSGSQLVTRSHGGSFGAAFSPDGRRLASSSLDGTVKLWAVAGDSLADEEPLTLAGHTAAVYRVAWGPDGRWPTTASRDGTRRIYSGELKDRVALARTRVTRHLTSDQCRQYLHQEQCPD